MNKSLSSNIGENAIKTVECVCKVEEGKWYIDKIGNFLKEAMPYDNMTKPSQNLWLMIPQMLVSFLTLMRYGTINLLNYEVTEMGALADPGTLFPPVQITKQYQPRAPADFCSCTSATWIIIFILVRKIVVIVIFVKTKKFKSDGNWKVIITCKS